MKQIIDPMSVPVFPMPNDVFPPNKNPGRIPDIAYRKNTSNFGFSKKLHKYIALKYKALLLHHQNFVTFLLILDEKVLLQKSLNSNLDRV